MKRFWKTTILVTVLSEGDSPPEFGSLGQVAREIDYGDMSGAWNDEHEEVTRDTMSNLLEEQGSDPAFLLGEDDE